MTLRLYWPEIKQSLFPVLKGDIVGGLGEFSAKVIQPATPAIVELLEDLFSL